MLAARIIPTLLVNNGKLVKGRNFKSWRSIGHPAQAAQTHAMRGVDELCILDVNADKPNTGLIRELSQWMFSPVTVGGGIRASGDIQALLNNGADKVMLGTATEDLDFVWNASNRYGSQAIACAIDYKMVNGVPCVMTRSGKEKCEQLNDDGPAPMHPVAWAKILADHGAGEILLTSIDREGMMEGYDLQMIEGVAKSVDIPVIAHGGCGTLAHTLEAIKAGANAVGIGAMFAFTDITPRDVSLYLHANNIEVRLT